MQIQTTTLTAPALLDKAHQDLKKACRQFDAYFTDLMLKEMRKTVPEGGLLGEQSNQREIFQSMMDQSLADNMSQHGALGQMMYEELAPSLGTRSEEGPLAPNNGGIREEGQPHRVAPTPSGSPLLGRGGDPASSGTHPQAEPCTRR